MQNPFFEKTESVIAHFKNNDNHVGFRRLIDCALETGDINVYKACVQLYMEKNADETVPSADKCIAMLQHLQTLQISAPEWSATLLEGKALEKHYSRGKFALGPIDITLDYGNVWGLVGENGNGKTTLLRILAKDLNPSSGALTFAPHIQQKNLYNHRTLLHYVPQRTPTWFGPLQDNLKFAAVHYGIKGSANHWLVQMMMLRFGLFDYRHHRWHELSSGYKMRFELARTMLCAPQLLLLDEPLANLDILSQQIILEDIKNLAQSIRQPMGVILSSQQLYEVEKVADNVLFLKNGAPVLLNEANTNAEQGPMIVAELEIIGTRDDLTSAIATLPLTTITFIGGQYIIRYRDDGYGITPLMKALIAANIHIKYVRDISTSTRRLFSA